MTPEEIQKLAKETAAALDLSKFKGDIVAFKYVENEINNVDKDGIGIQNNYYPNGAQPEQTESTSQSPEQPTTPPTDSLQPEEHELSVGDFDLHLQLLKDAMIKVQEIPYSHVKYESAIFHSYHWLAALQLGKDLGLLTGYEDFMNLMKGNMRHIPNSQQNISQYSKYISGDKYPDWKQPDKASEPYFLRLKFIADHIYKLYCVGCQREKIKPRGSYL